LFPFIKGAGFVSVTGALIYRNSHMTNMPLFLLLFRQPGFLELDIESLASLLHQNCLNAHEWELLQALR
jgi:hypothetical protein